MPIAGFIGFLVLSFVIVLVMLRPKKSEKDLEKRLKVLALTIKNENDAEPEALALPGKQSGALVEKLGEYLERFDFSDDLELLILHANSKSTVGGVVGGSILAAIAAGIVMHLAFKV